VTGSDLLRQALADFASAEHTEDLERAKSCLIDAANALLEASQEHDSAPAREALHSLHELVQRASRTEGEAVTTDEAFERLNQAIVDFRAACDSVGRAHAVGPMHDAFMSYWGLQWHPHQGVRDVAERFDRMYQEAAEMVFGLPR